VPIHTLDPLHDPRRSVRNYQRCGRSAGRSVTTPGALRIANRFFASMPDHWLIAAGQMLYRHIG